MCEHFQFAHQTDATLVNVIPLEWFRAAKRKSIFMIKVRSDWKNIASFLSYSICNNTLSCAKLNGGLHWVFRAIAMHWRFFCQPACNRNSWLEQCDAILTSLSLSLELSASLGATDDVVSRSDALPLSSDVPGSFAIVSEFCKMERKNETKTQRNYCESIKSYDKMLL